MKKTRYNMHVEFTAKSLNQFAVASIIAAAVWAVMEHTPRWPIFAFLGVGIAFHLLAHWALRFLRPE